MENHQRKQFKELKKEKFIWLVVWSQAVIPIIIAAFIRQNFKMLLTYKPSVAVNIKLTNLIFIKDEIKNTNCLFS
jgi:hypothetical protein